MKTKVAVVLIALFLVLTIVLFCQIFNVRHVEIVADGALPASEEEIVRTSGIELNQSIFALSKEGIRTRVEGAFQDRSVAVDRVEKVFPNTVKLYMRVRTPVVAVFLSDGSGVVPTDRDFQLTYVKSEAEVDFRSVIAVRGANVVSSFDTDELIFLRRVIYAFFRAGFDETSLTAFLKEFRFTEQGLYAAIRTETDAEFLIPYVKGEYELTVKNVSELYSRFIETPETERGGKIYRLTEA